jgi:hypothetical protein
MRFVVVHSIALFATSLAGAQALVALDPFGQATSGLAACPSVKPPLLTPEEARVEAHVRAERGTRCGMDGSCEAGGAYRRDSEINAQVIAAIGADARFRDTSVWVTTTRRWVTLQGCVRSNAQRKALARFVAKQPNVERVFDELASKPR